jgi:hypothetical protein
MSSIGLQRLLFILPKDEEILVAAIVSIKSYVAKLAMAKVTSEVVLVGEETWLTDILVPPMYMIVSSVEEALNLIPGYDLAVDLGEKKSREVSNKTNRSAASGYGVILGFEIVNELPRLPFIPEPVKEVAIIGMGWASTAIKLFESANRKGIPTTILVPSGEKEAFYKELLKYKMIIGNRSIWTYLAAAAIRPVIEVYSLEENEKNFLAKWSSGKYYMFAVDDMSYVEKNFALLWRSFERVYNGIRKLQSVQQAP